MITDMMYVKYNTVGRAKHAREEIHPDFETQETYHQKSKTRVSVTPQKWFMSSNFFKIIIHTHQECNWLATDTAILIVMSR